MTALSEQHRPFFFAPPDPFADFNRREQPEFPDTRTAPTPEIWLVEDNQADVYLVNKAITFRGLRCELKCYADGEKAIIALGATPKLPDLILVDLKLPRQDGFDVLKAITSSPRLVGVRVAVLTSSDAGVDRVRASLYGKPPYILKPSDYDEFLETVGAAIENCLTPDTACASSSEP